MPSPRYQALRKRSFERHLDLFLTTCFLRSPIQALSQVTPALYQAFQPTTQEWTFYVQSQQAKSYAISVNNINIGVLDKAIKAWLAENAPYLNDYEALHQCISPAAFNALLEPTACAYCKITQAEFKALRQAGQLQTKRLRTRGTSFEIDCRLPELGYTEGNLARCCYWCNNAKTDEFSDTEFQPIADALALVWRRRLTLLEPRANMA